MPVTVYRSHGTGGLGLIFLEFSDTDTANRPIEVCTNVRSLGLRSAQMLWWPKPL